MSPGKVQLLELYRIFGTTLQAVANNSRLCQLCKRTCDFRSVRFGGCNLLGGGTDSDREKLRLGNGYPGSGCHLLPPVDTNRPGPGSTWRRHCSVTATQNRRFNWPFNLSHISLLFGYTVGGRQSPSAVTRRAHQNDTNFSDQNVRL